MSAKKKASPGQSNSNEIQEKVAEKAKITKLTPENEAAKPIYVKKWIDIGLNTDRLDAAETTRIIHKVQTVLLAQEETPVLIVDNPIQAWIGCHLERQGVAPDKILEGIADFVSGKKRFELEPFCSPFLDGAFSAPIFSFYDFMFNEVGVEIEPELRQKYEIWQETVKLGMIFPMPGVCLVSQKPLRIQLDEAGQLHADCNGPAIEYAGELGDKIYSLHGTVVPEELAVTPAGQLKVEYYNELKNADHKMEFVRKFGVERMLGMGKKLDSFENYPNEDWWQKSEYELWDMKVLFPGVNFAPHLKMTNQTTQVFHVEAVSPKCRTLPEALNERFGNQDINIIGIA
jgi:hypothetical protein